MSTLSYLKNLARDRQIASITPTSRFGVNRILRCMDFDRARVIVEYGPGLGVFTEQLLVRAHHEAKIIAIEANPNFARTLIERFDDERLHVINDSAERVLEILRSCGAEKADYIISGIPFSMFPVELKDTILRNTREALTSAGRFFVYQFVLSSVAKPEIDIKRKLSEHMEILRSEIELLNIPPLRIYEAASSSSGG